MTDLARQYPNGQELAVQYANGKEVALGGQTGGVPEVNGKEKATVKNADKAHG